MAHAASQLKKKADLELTAAEEEKDRKRRTRKRSREGKKKVRTGQDGTRPRGGGWTLRGIVMVVWGSSSHTNNAGLSTGSKILLCEGIFFFFFFENITCETAVKDAAAWTYL